MKQSPLLLFLIHLTMASCFVSADEVDSEVLRVRHRVIEYEDQFRAASATEAKQTILTDMEKYIRKNAEGKEDIAQYLMWTGHRYESMKSLGQASRLFMEVRDMPGIGDFWRIDALRVLAQMELYVNNNPKKAGEMYQSILDKVNRTNDSHVRATAHSYLKDAYSKGAFSLDRQGRFSDAIFFRDSALEDKRLRLDVAERSWFSLENARGYAKAGERAESVALYDRLFKEYPSFGISNGDIVSYRLEQVAAYGYKKDDPKRLELLLGIWKNGDYAKFPQIIAMGADLATRFSEAGNLPQALAIGEELLKRLEYLRTNAEEARKELYSIDSQYACALIQISAICAQIGNVKRAIELIEMFLKEFPHHESTKNAEHWLEHLKRDDPLGALDLSQEINLTSYQVGIEDDTDGASHLPTPSESEPKKCPAADLQQTEAVGGWGWRKNTTVSLAIGVCSMCLAGMTFARFGRKGR